MKRWWLVAILFLSVGLNLGLLISVVTPDPAPGPRATPVDGPSVGVDPRPGDVPGARPGVRRPGGEPGANLEQLVRRLGLEGEAAERFVTSQRAFMERARTTRIELERVRATLKGELLADEPSRERIAELVERSGRLQVELEQSFVEHVLVARELLDGEAEGRYLELLGRMTRGAGPGPTPDRRRLRRP